MDKTLGVIGLIAVAVVIFVLSIDDQTPPMTAISGKVTRQRIEAQNSDPVKDVAPNNPTTRESSDLTSSGPTPPFMSDAAADPAVADLKAQLKTERDRVAQLTGKLGEVERGSAAQVADLNVKLDDAKRGAATQVSELTTQLDAARHGSAAEVADINAKLDETKRTAAAQVTELSGKLDAAQHGLSGTGGGARGRAGRFEACCGRAGRRSHRKTGRRQAECGRTGRGTDLKAGRRQAGVPPRPPHLRPA